MATSTPWGIADNVVKCICGVSLVETPSHGGIRISRGLAERQLSDACRYFGYQMGGYYFFEEDCAYALPFFEHPEWFTNIYREGETKDILRDNAKATLERWYPEYFKMINEKFKAPTYKVGNIFKVKRDIELTNQIKIIAGKDVVVVDAKKLHFMDIESSYIFRLTRRNLGYYFED